MKSKLLSKASIIAATLVVAAFSVAVAYAACPSSASQSDGINTHSSSSLAGLIVQIKHNDVWYNDSITVAQKAGYSGEYIDLVNSSGQVTGTTTSKTWDAGSTFYIAGQSTACKLDGVIWMGYGFSNAYGNKYGLDCKSSSGTHPEFNIKDNITTSSTGWWKYYVDSSGADFVEAFRAYTSRPSDSLLDGADNDNPVVRFTVVNGYTARVVLNYQPVPKYTLSYNANGGTGAPASQSVFSGSSTPVSESEPSYTGHTFTGWKDSAGVSYAKKQSVTLTANKTLYAQWSTDTFPITPSVTTGCNINPNTVQNVSYGTNSVAFTGSANSGYRFDGLSVDGITTVLATSPYIFTTVTAPHTIRAMCTPLTYTVTISKAGTGTGSISLTSGALVSGSLTGATFPRSGVVGHGTTLGISAIPNATSRASWSGNCSGSSTVAGATVVTSLANIIANKTCVITFDLVGTVSPVVELISPSPTENPVDTNGAVILATNYTKLEARLRIPGYVSASGGTAKLGITYAENKVGGIAKTVQGSVTGLSSEGAISLIVDASDLVAGQVYIWDAFGQVVDGSPQGTNGFSVSKDEVESAEQWKFIYRVGGTEGGGGGEVENFSCKVVPSSGTTGLPVGISINGAPVETTTYVVTTGDGNTFDVLGKDLPYYYSYDTVGSYTVGVALKTGTASGLPCSTTIQVNAGTDGGGGSEVLTNQN